MQQTTSLYRHEHFLKAVATLISGKTVALAIPLLITPIIARLFDPIHFGAAALLISLSTMIGSVSSFCYDRAIVLPHKKSDASALFFLSNLILILVCLTIFLVFIAISFFGISLPYATQLGVWSWLIPVFVLTIGFMSVVEIWLIRSKYYSAVAYADVVSPLSTGASRLFFGSVAGSSIWGLIVGDLIGQLGKILILYKAAKQFPRDYLTDPSKGKSNTASSTTLYTKRWLPLRTIAVEYRDFPLFNAPSRFTESFSKNLPILCFGIMFSPAVVGLYAMAHRLVRKPVNVVATAFRRVYVQKSAEMFNSDRPLKSSLLKTTLILAVTGIIPFGLLGLYGKETLTFLLGERWTDSGKFVEILVPWLYMIWVSAPSSSLLIVLRKQSLRLKIQLFVLLFRLAVFATAFILSKSVIWTLYTFVGISVLSQLAIMLAAFNLVQINDRRILNAKLID